MDSQLFIQEIRTLIARDELAAALGKMRFLQENTPLLNEVLQQLGRFEHIQK